jgi:hypothetical protein
MPDLVSRSKAYRDRAAHYLALTDGFRSDYFKQICGTISAHFIALANAEDRFVARQAEFWRRFERY